MADQKLIELLSPIYFKFFEKHYILFPPFLSKRPIYLKPFKIPYSIFSNITKST